MTSKNSFWRGLMVTTLVALVLLVIGWLGPARAAELDCQAMADSLNPGDHYSFQLQIQSKMIRLEKGDDFCTEPVKKWFKRQLILPPPAREEMPLPKIPPSQQQTDNAPLLPSLDDNALPAQRKSQIPDMGLDTDSGAAPLPIAREFVKPKVAGEVPVEGGVPNALEGKQSTPEGAPAVTLQDHVSSDPKVIAAAKAKAAAAAAAAAAVPGTEQEIPVMGVAAPPPPVRDDTLVKRCDRDLVSFWSPGEHEIEGQKFWLSGVFTVDLDSDGRVDDVGFKIKSEGKIGNILNYFPSTEGRHSGKTIDSLKLDDDRDIHRLCPGNITFERADPVALQKKKIAAANQVKALVPEGSKNAEAPAEAPPEEAPPEEAPKEPEPPKKKTSNIVLIVAGIAMLMLLAGGIGLAFAMRNFTRSKKDDDEDEYEDDDEDED
ncbi:MAG: hypothetical protein HQ513_08560 [Rhodospirillales bacterium]|nr:hypothetical protein [Rhodospirillales bacterium]